jgi:nucleoid DNA-binding protein
MSTTKKDLIDRIAERTSDTHTLVKTVVQHFFQEVTEELAEGNRLEFRDFGVFETKTSPARRAQNPRTLEKVAVPAKRRVVFKPGRLMRDELNGAIQKQPVASTGQRQREKDRRPCPEQL